MTTRQECFDAIKTALRPSLCFSGEGALVAEGDSLTLLRLLPAHSVSLILTDPPYHSTKKQNIYGDTAFAEDQHYLEWMAKYAVEWRRVLKPNGSLFCFCASSMSAHLRCLRSLMSCYPKDLMFYPMWYGRSPMTPASTAGKAR